MRQQRVPTCSATLSALAACSLYWPVTAAAAAGDGPSAAAKDGTFTGMVENGTKKWLGVPYAEPPIGDLRWRKSASPLPACAACSSSAHFANRTILFPALLERSGA